MHNSSKASTRPLSAESLPLHPLSSTLSPGTSETGGSSHAKLVSFLGFSGSSKVGLLGGLAELDEENTVKELWGLGLGVGMGGNKEADSDSEALSAIVSS